MNYANDSEGEGYLIHLGVNFLKKYKDIDSALILSGQYNINKHERNIETLNKTTKTNYNSYSVRISEELSKKIGNKRFLKPYLGIDLSYLTYDSFSEKNSTGTEVRVLSEEYVSILPKIGIKAGESLDKFSLYSNLEFSKEVGDIDKIQKFEFENFEGIGKLVETELENENILNLKMGIDYKNDKFSLGAEIERLFKTEDEFIANLKLTYSF